MSCPGDPVSNGGENEARSGRDEPAIGPDTLFRLLADRRRRCVLRYFDGEASASAHLDELIDAVHGAETDEDRRPPRSEIRTSLHHVHLPILDDAGVIEYDADGRTVRYVGSDRVETVLAAARRP